MGTSFGYSKTLAMEGSILLIIGLIPPIGWVLGIVGVILLLRAMREFANYYQDNSIYQNSLTGVKYYIAALISLAIAAAGFIVGLVIVGTATTIAIGSVVGLAVGIAFLVVAFIFFVLASRHLRKTLNTLAQKTGEHSFETAGTLLWIGSLLTIIGIGVLLIFIAWVFAVVGFFTMKSPMQQPYAYQPYGYNPPPAQPTGPTQAYCSNCGTPIQPQAAYCSSCGKKTDA